MYCNLCNYLFILGDQSLKITRCKQRRRDKENLFLSFFNFTVNFYMYIIADVCHCYTAILYADNAMNTRWNWQEEAPICFLMLSVIFPWKKRNILPVFGSFLSPQRNLLVLNIDWYKVDGVYNVYNLYTCKRRHGWESKLLLSPSSSSPTSSCHYCHH